MHAQCHIPGQSRARLEAQPSSRTPSPAAPLPQGSPVLPQRALFVCFGHTALQHVGPRGQGPNRCPLQWKHRVIPTGPLEKSHFPRESWLLLCSIFPEALVAESDAGKTTILDPQDFSNLLVKYKMVQTLVIGLEKQKDQPTPSKALPKLSVPVLLRRTSQSLWKEDLLSPAALSQVGDPSQGPHPLKAPHQEEPKKCIQICCPPL